uniref:Calcium voltage-gated channel auxiliary subunit alpha2delta 3 n=1 Tax=Myotis myotis TaxID=51298 RepID=A0A7J7UB77_MYOMY|nr:calcium voltage-gated channel auxiliary subunit alpha2delta 3 [Myotis myotis]
MFSQQRSKGILLGVVGTDVPVKELLKTIPKYKLGIHGYAFAITNNGYILTHPELRPLYEEGKKRRKPNYSSVDLSEVEWEDRDDVVSDLFSSLVRRELHCTHFCTWRLPQEPARGLPEGHLATRGSRDNGPLY